MTELPEGWDWYEPKEGHTEQEMREARLLRMNRNYDFKEELFFRGAGSNG